MVLHVDTNFVGAVMPITSGIVASGPHGGVCGCEAARLQRAAVALECGKALLAILVELPEASLTLRIGLGQLRPGSGLRRV
jgi:hypothetical protein